MPIGKLLAVGIKKFSKDIKDPEKALRVAKRELAAMRKQGASKSIVLAAKDEVNRIKALLEKSNADR